MIVNVLLPLGFFAVGVTLSAERRAEGASLIELPDGRVVCTVLLRHLVPVGLLAAASVTRRDRLEHDRDDSGGPTRQPALARVVGSERARDPLAIKPGTQAAEQRHSRRRGRQERRAHGP